MDIPVSKKQHPLLNKRHLLWLTVAIVVAVLVSIPLRQGSALPSVDQDDVWLGKVKRGELKQQVLGVGELAPKEVRWIVATSPGTLEKLNIKPGAQVSKDSIIAQIRNPQLQRQRQQAKWDLDAAQANLLAVTAEMQEQKLEQQMLITEAELALEAAKMQQQAQAPLAAKHIISDIDFENVKLQTRQSEVILDFRKKSLTQRLEVIEARLVAEKAEVQTLENILADIDEKIAELTIRASISGVLQEVSVEIGQKVDEGDTLALVADPQSLQAELQIPQVQAKDLQLGLPVSIDTRNGLLDGLISRIDPRVSEGNVQVDVEFVGNDMTGLRPSLSVTGTITIESIPDTIFIERPVGSLPERDAQLFVFNPDTAVATKQKVRFGRASVSHIQVLSGLNIGDQVLISDISSFEQQNAIRLSQ